MKALSHLIFATCLTAIPVSALAETQVPVNVDNFVRAATDIEIGKYLELSGGVNQFYHERQPTPIDIQPTIRMNRDTIYSMAVVDISEGAMLSLPETDGRYQSVQVVNQDHYMNDVILGAGEHALTIEEFDTPYVILLVRTLVDSADPADVAAANALQDAMVLTAGAATPFEMPAYDQDGFKEVLSAALELARFTPDSARTFGPKEDVDPVRYFLGAAFGWGGLPESEAYYLNVDPDLPVGAYKIDVPADVPVEAFWSVSLYNSDGFFEENDLNAYSVNSVTGEKNADGSTAIYLGECDEGKANCLPLMDGWNYIVRLYQPSPEIIDGSWEFPSAEPLN